MSLHFLPRDDLERTTLRFLRAIVRSIERRDYPCAAIQAQNLAEVLNGLAVWEHPAEVEAEGEHGIWARAHERHTDWEGTYLLERLQNVCKHADPHDCCWHDLTLYFPGAEIGRDEERPGQICCWCGKLYKPWRNTEAKEP